jgi:glycosyltransferase involved in cell wall biosynthesis
VNITSGDDREGQSSQLVSVIIPAYNAEATIDATLKSVRLQTHRNLEIIVVDDGSVDRTNSIAMAHSYADDRVRVIAQDNSGVAAARNKGWQAATSTLIAFIDADDVWATSKIQRQLELILKGGEKVGLVYTWYCEIDEHNQILRRPVQQTARGKVLDLLLLGNLIGNGSSVLVRRQVLQAVGGFDSALREGGAHGCEDYLLYFRIAAISEFDVIPEYLTGYRVLGPRMSSDRPRMLRSWLMVAEEMNICFPERSTLIDLGMEYYVRSLLIDAFALSDLAQVRPLISVWAAHRSKGTIFTTLGMLVRTFIRGLMYKAQMKWNKIQGQRGRNFTTI